MATAAGGTLGALALREADRACRQCVDERETWQKRSVPAFIVTGAGGITTIVGSQFALFGSDPRSPGGRRQVAHEYNERLLAEHGVELP